jgi:cell division protein FtsQ
LFYKQVLSKTGFDKYKIINVQYKGQVVVSKYAGDPKVDSVQLRKNVEKLLQQARDAQNDTVIRAMQVTGKYIIDVDSASAPVTDLPVMNNINPEKQSNPNPRLSISSPPVRQTADGGGQAVNPKPKKMEKKIPKAVMPKKNEE